MDSLSPEGHSVNNVISEAHYSLLCITVEDMVEVVIKKEWGAQLQKVVCNAYWVLFISLDN